MADENKEPQEAAERKEEVVILNGSWFDRSTGTCKSRGDVVSFTEKQARVFGLENLGFAGDVPKELAGKSIAEAEREEKLRFEATKAEDETDKSDDKDKKPAAGSTSGASKDVPKDDKK